MNEKYPIVKDIVPSQSTVLALKNLLYSQDGILSAHLSYLYQSWILSVKNKDLGKYVKMLATNNEQILDALGNIIVGFGGDPNFTTANGRNWTTQFLITTKNENMFLRQAIQMESSSIKNIESYAARIENESLRVLLNSIKEDKEKIVKDLQKFASN